jgi:5-methylcytosine-specific restriction enzyme A
MGQRAKRQCNEPHCTQLADGPYCEKHLHDNQDTRYSKEYDKQRGTSTARGYDSRRWRNGMRPYVLQRDPMCRIAHFCNGMEWSTEVDHVIPAVVWVSMGNDFYDEKNLQGCCHSCHSWKTATVDSTFANKESK